MDSTLEQARTEALKVIETAKQAAVQVIEEAKKVNVEKDRKLEKMMHAHFEDDKKAFASIKSLQEKHEEISRNNGEHMSHIRSDLTEVNTKMDKQNIVLEEHTKLLLLVKPILDRYEQNEAAKKTAIRWTKFLVGVGGVIGAWLVVKEFIKDILLK